MLYQGKHWGVKVIRIVKLSVWSSYLYGQVIRLVKFSVWSSYPTGQVIRLVKLSVWSSYPLVKLAISVTVWSSYPPASLAVWSNYPLTTRQLCIELVAYNLTSCYVAYTPHLHNEVEVPYLWR